jgi:uncharacterized protein with PQ loop repeat
MALSPILQIRVIVRERDARGTSLGWVLILLVGFVLWLTYGLVNRDVPIIITNVVALVVTAVLLVVLRVVGRDRPEPGPAPTP